MPKNGRFHDCDTCPDNQAGWCRPMAFNVEKGQICAHRWPRGAQTWAQAKEMLKLEGPVDQFSLVRSLVAADTFKESS